MKILKKDGTGVQRLYNRGDDFQKQHIYEKVRAIINDVRTHGDEAVLKYTKKFDKVKLTAKELPVSEAEISAAYQGITSDFISTLKIVIHNVSNFYKRQKTNKCSFRHKDGIVLKECVNPLDTVGVYVPAGTAPLVSTVYMSVLPAKVAGVKRIIICTPPNKDGYVDPYILAVANLLKVNEIYKVGGAQAIAAMALGTKTIPRVDKIIGPGNMYVTEAKRQVFGYCDIDMLAGPSELTIIANRHSNPQYIVADLEGQAEHLGGLAVLVSTSKQLIKQVKDKITNGYIIYAKNTDEAVEIVNKIAPEHLQIMTNNPSTVAKKIKNAGAIFLGDYSPTALGDYVAGPSHVLPTMGSARFFSGLAVTDFMKKSHVISYSRKALEKARDSIEKIANLEGLVKHRDSVSIRFK